MSPDDVQRQTIREQNLRAAADALMPRKPEATNEAEPAPPRADELDELRAQMAAMQKKLDELGK